MGTPKVSIITINFNDAIGLQKTITSVKNQTYSNIEYIIIDGGSTDGSADILVSEQSGIHYWVSEPDTGIFNAMNKGIRQASGDYLQFLNSRDVYTDNGILEKFVNNPMFHGDIIYGDYQFTDGKKVYPDTLYPSYFIKTSLPHQSTLLKRSVFEKMGFYDEKYRIGADRAFFIKCYLSGQFVFNHIPCLLVLFDKNGISNDPSFIEEKKIEDETIFKEMYGSDYEIFKAELEAEKRAKNKKRNSFLGILIRIKRRINRI